VNSGFGGDESASFGAKCSRRLSLRARQNYSDSRLLMLGIDERDKNASGDGPRAHFGGWHDGDADDGQLPSLAMP
jgi:hypothetical protein